LSLLGCGKEDPKFLFEKKPIPELPYQGFRQDIPDGRRGNAVFVKGVFTRDGRYLVTLGPGIRVWDAATGALLLTLPASLDGNDALVADGKYRKVLARRGDVAPGMPEAMGLWIWNLQDGSRQSAIPEASWAGRAHPIGITPTGGAVVLREGRIETWALDGSGRRLSIKPPPGRQFCQPSDPIVHDKRCAELSRSGRWLALIDRDASNPMAPSWTWLVDLERSALRRVLLPDSVDVRGGHGFAFSPDEKTLALQVTAGMWIGYPLEGDAGPGADAGRFVRGEHQRGLFLLPMSYSADARRIVALGDQFTVATYDAGSGTLVGRVKPPFEDLEGALRVSADGSRAIAYRYIADILVVIDGATGTQRGYVCPYFCNRAHNPVAVPYAVSPDGRRVATGGRLGAGLWDIDTDTLIAPLMDPALPPLKPR
jgi:WD40 repeat protein